MAVQRINTELPHQRELTHSPLNASDQQVEQVTVRPVDPLAAACAGLCGTQFELDEPVYGHPDGGCNQVRVIVADATESSSNLRRVPGREPEMDSAAITDSLDAPRMSWGR